MPDAVLLVFAKVPETGAVKTRLAPPLTPAEAAGLYRAFLTDALVAFVRSGVAVRLCLAPSSSPMPPGVVPGGVAVHAQRGDGLGRRMAHAFDEAFADGFARAVVVGTDHPTLPPARLAEAFGALGTPGAVVLGPSDDGGFYLLGLDRPRPGLFAGMTYSHDRVFDETHARARHAPTVVLSPGYDVDDASGLARLVGEWRSGAEVGPETAAVLARLVAAYPGLDAPGGRPEPAPSG